MKITDSGFPFSLDLPPLFDQAFLAPLVDELFAKPLQESDLKILLNYEGDNNARRIERLKQAFAFYSKSLYALDGSLNSAMPGETIFGVLNSINQLERDLSQQFCLPLKLKTNYAGTFIKQKKVHEINAITQFLIEENLLVSPMVDLCSGQGHLGRTLASVMQKNANEVPDVCCLEKDPALIREGEDLGKKMLGDKKTGRSPLSFHALSIDSISLPLFMKQQTKSWKLSTGLHTCGSLAVHHLSLPINHHHQAALNFGCCYFNLHPQKEVNLSQLAQEQPMPWNPHALTLATRAHCQYDPEEFLQSWKVKFYRFALHLWLKKELDIDSDFPFGSEHPRLYLGPFVEFAKAKMARLFPTELAKRNEADLERELNLFISAPELGHLFLNFMTLTLFRWRFGRVLEFILLIDRALWLKDKGLDAKMFVLFDEKISPRNIGILARLKN